MDNCIANVPHYSYTDQEKVLYMDRENKTYSMSIRVIEEELDKLKQTARLESYAYL